MFDPIIVQYLKEIQAIPLLKAAEEKATSRLARAGNPEARQLMIRSNLRLVVKLARVFMGRGLPFVDLVAEGNVGLIRAVEGFDPEKDLRFSTYAAWWIKESIRRALHDVAKMVRVPAYMVDLIAQWKAKEAELQNTLGRLPYMDEVAEALDIQGEKLTLIKRALNASQMGSLSGTGQDEAWNLFDIVEDKRIPTPDKQIFDQQEQRKLASLLDQIDAREAAVLKLRFGLENRQPMTLKEVGVKLKLTRERVRQLETQALKRLSRMFRENES